MAFPTLPAFELMDGQVAVLKKGTDMIGQAARVNPQAQSATSKHARLGSSSKKTRYDAVESRVSVEFYTEHTLQQLGEMLGTSFPASGGWVGTEKIQLNSTLSAYDLTIEVYNDNVTGTLEWTLTMKNFKPATFSIQFQADNVSMATLDGECDEFYIEPEAALGA